MAIKHNSTKLCDYLIQAIDGKVTLAGCFPNIFCTEIPLSRPIGVMVEFTGELGDSFRITVEGPPEAELSLPLADGAIEPLQVRHPLEQRPAAISGMIGIRFPVEGIYRVVLWSGDEIVHEHPFAVIILRPENATGPA